MVEVQSTVEGTQAYVLASAVSSCMYCTRCLGLATAGLAARIQQVVRLSDGMYAYSAPLSPPNRYQCRSNLADSALRCKQIELGCRVPGVLDLEPDAQVVEVFANRRRNGRGMGTGADDEEV